MIGWTKGPTRLFNIRKDPRERNDVFDGHPKIAAELSRRLDAVLPIAVVGDPDDSAPWRDERSYW